MGSKLILVAVALVTVECVNRDKFGAVPKPQEKFNEYKYMGDWYLQARMPSCSWIGSSDFTNFVAQYSKQAEGNILNINTWRSTDCASATLDLQPSGPAGSYSLTDPIGDVITGDHVVVATDYKRFAIYWGCVKKIGKHCVDPYATVNTRKRVPSAQVWKVIEKLLQHLWELNVTEMVRVVHDKKACIELNKPVQVAPSASMFKTY